MEFARFIDKLRLRKYLTGSYTGINMSHLRASANYVWSTEDVDKLGEGSAGTVYKARHKRTGEIQAVKMFHPAPNQSRALQLQLREFEVLSKLNHDNIVKMLAVEDEQSSGGKVIIMELCSGGSLFNILDDPKNAFGLEETEFFRVLHDLAAGMKHLRDQGIVHRDIKPGNILKYVYDDGRVLYKLTDFGAARELQDEEQFMSLYGTEEYLHPDIYAKAVLRRQSATSFEGTIDLWSFGVTLYHVATGHLPFRPFGGRRNQETMLRITRQKEPGYISGVQHTENGPIEYSKELPKTCQLSLGGKLLLTPLLQGLLELDINSRWTFNKFFDQVARITNKRGVHVFSALTATPLVVYIDRKEGFAKLQELIAVQTDIRANQQLLLFENCLLTQHISQLQKAETYPDTTKQNPIFLFNEDNTEFSRIAHLDIPAYAQFSSALMMDNDYHVAKRSAAVVYLRERYFNDLLDRRLLLREAVNMSSHVLARDIEHLRGYVSQFCSLCEETERRVTQFFSTHKLQMTTLSLLLRAVEEVSPDLVQLQSDLVTSTESKHSSFKQSLEGVEHVKHYIDDCHKKVVQDKQLLSRWTTLLAQGGFDPDLSHRDATRLKTMMGTQARTVRSVWEHFYRDKQQAKTSRLSYNDEQIHKFDRVKLTECCNTVIVMTEEGIRQFNSEHNRFHKWFSEASEEKQYLRRIEVRVGSLSEKQAQLSAQLTKYSTDYCEKLQTLLSRVDPREGFSMLSDANRFVTDGTSRSQAAPGAEDDGKDSSRSSSKPLSSYSRSLVKELNRCLGSLKEESTAVKVALQENLDQLKQLEELTHENGR